MANAANEAKIREGKEKDLRDRERYVADLQGLLSIPGGRRFLWEQLTRCRIYEQSAEMSGSWTYFNEGSRKIGLQLLADIIEADDEKYLLMMRESKGV